MAARLQTRFTPILSFKSDDSVKKSVAIGRLIDEAVASDQREATSPERTGPRPRRRPTTRKETRRTRRPAGARVAGESPFHGRPVVSDRKSDEAIPTRMAPMPAPADGLRDPARLRLKTQQNRLMATQSKAQFLTDVYTLLKRRYKPKAERNAARLSVLKAVVYGICHEDTTREHANQALSRFKDEFFDWNEVRVSSLEEIQENLAGIPEAAERARRIRRFLRQLFNRTYGFNLDAPGEEAAEGGPQGPPDL